MTADPDGTGPTNLSPDEAFAVLGNETRVQILRTLGQATEPLPFSDVYDRVDVGDTGNFTYHLERLVGHFVRRTEQGYELHRAGHRVVEAILSGAMTEAPVLGPTTVEKPCSYCGTRILVHYHDGEVRKYCPECVGTYGTAQVTSDGSDTVEYGYLGALDLPPAGLQGRSPIGVLEAAYSWSLHEHFAWAHGTCPRCSATVETDVSRCRDHDPGDAACDLCGERYAVTVDYRCTNCLADHGGMFANHLLTDPDLLQFLLAHDINPLSPPPRRFSAAVWVYEEEIRETDPFEATFTFTIDGDSLTLRVDDDFQVVGVS